MSRFSHTLNSREMTDPIQCFLIHCKKLYGIKNYELKVLLASGAVWAEKSSSRKSIRIKKLWIFFRMTSQTPSAKRFLTRSPCPVWDWRITFLFHFFIYHIYARETSFLRLVKNFLRNKIKNTKSSGDVLVTINEPLHFERYITSIWIWGCERGTE